ncbi:MAG: hypothetical protein U0R78_01580 [Nocardioidaceae bacterium]
MTPVTENTWSESKGGTVGGDGNPASYATREHLARQIRNDYFSADGVLRFGMAPQELAITPEGEVVREYALARELGARMTQHANQVMVRQLFKVVEALHRLQPPAIAPLRWCTARSTPPRSGTCSTTAG